MAPAMNGLGGELRHVEQRSSSPFVIGIAGGTASGKTTVCRCIIENLGGERVVLLSMDEFYRDLTEEEVLNISNVSFDEPDAFDVETLIRCLDQLLDGEDVDVPVYDFVTSRRSLTETRRVNAADVIIVEGILALHCEEIRSRCSMKIFVDTDDDLRLARRLRRDTVERGRNFEGVLGAYTRFVKPAFDKYVLPSKQTADVIIPWRENRPAAVDLITQHVRLKLDQNPLGRHYPNFRLMPRTMQTRGMHTFIRDRHLCREDFVFYADRLCRLAIEFALSALPFEDKTVTTPTADFYNGLKWTAKLCGVSIIRSGEAMESALRLCCTGIPIGKILIHSEQPGRELLYKKFPHDIAQRHVLLMDPVMSTGGSACQAIQVLKDHGVLEERIVMVTLLVTPEGVQRVCSRFPRCKVITSEVDRGTNASNMVVPGVGDFGDRYFGTTNDEDAKIAAFSCTRRVGHGYAPSASGSERPAPGGVASATTTPSDGATPNGVTPNGVTPEGSASEVSSEGDQA